MTVYTDQVVFDAIVAATHIEDGAIVVSVPLFIKAFNGHQDRALCNSLELTAAAPQCSSEIVRVAISILNKKSPDEITFTEAKFREETVKLATVELSPGKERDPAIRGLQKMTDKILRMWTVYDHPTDYPHSYVARLFEVYSDASIKATGSIIVANDIETLQEIMEFQMHLTRLSRFPEDDPKIVETWM
jgi:hypothetical protein